MSLINCERNTFQGFSILLVIESELKLENYSHAIRYLSSGHPEMRDPNRSFSPPRNSELYLFYCTLITYFLLTSISSAFSSGSSSTGAAELALRILVSKMFSVERLSISALSSLSDLTFSHFSNVGRPYCLLKVSSVDTNRHIHNTHPQPRDLAVWI